MARANALCCDGLRLWLRQFAQLLPTVLLVSLLVHDAVLLLVALLRPSSVSAVYLALCLLGYQGTSSSKVTGGRLARLAAAAAAAAVGMGLGLADSTVLEQSRAAWVFDLWVFLQSAALCTAATRRWMGPDRRRPLFHEAWGHALLRQLERQSQPGLLLLLLLIAGAVEAKSNPSPSPSPSPSPNPQPLIPTRTLNPNPNPNPSPSRIALAQAVSP